MPVSAQSQAFSETDFFDDAPLILTASRMSKPLDESPASVSVIDRQMIESSGVRELADIFRLVPGFIVGNYSGNTPVVTYQGLGNVFSRQIQVLVDGRSVFIPSFGGVPWTNLPLLVEDIERIEIIRGPNAVTYGANAFLATINIITRHAAEDIGARYSLTTSNNTNPNAADAYFRLGYQTHSLDWRFSAGNLKDDGFIAVNDSQESSKLNFRLDYQADNNRFWTFQVGSSHSISGKGEPGNPDNIVRDEDATNSYININWEQVRSNSSTSIRLTHTRQEVIDNFTPDPMTLLGQPITTYIDFDRDSNRTDLEIIQTEELDENLRFVYGASLRRDRVRSLFLLNDKFFHDIDTARLFTGIEWRLGEDWILDFGTTLEDSSITEQEYSPRFSVLYKLNPNHVLRFVASRAKRNPILYEHSGLTIFSVTAPAPIGSFDIKIFEGNPNLIPEDMVSYEVGLRSQLATNALSSDIKVFSYKISDFIDDISFLENAIDVASTDNMADARVSGIELALDFSPVAGLSIKSGFSVVSVDTDERNIEVSFPDKSAFLMAQYEWQTKHSLSASMYYVDDMEWIDTRYVTPSFNKLDLRYAYMLDKASETRLELIGQNLIEDYTDYLSENLSQKLYLIRLTGGF